jgi:predicted protein tyrosine phosphatase/membrane-associated phospholipid phosphatase
MENVSPHSRTVTAPAAPVFEPVKASDSESFRSRFRSALVTSIVLSVAFAIVYGVTNLLAARSADVGTWYYAWERHIPFVPILIIPYMSIDAFFFVAPFLCTTRAERRTLAKRILLAIAIAGLFFWLMPLMLAVERPVVEGWLGPIFRFLYGFDEPHNLCPSLHIALRTILVGTYVRHTRGWLRTLIHVWFSLIGLSTLLVYQHHVVDIVGGFMLAAVCYYAFVDHPLERVVTPNRKVGAMYAGAAALLAMLAFVKVWWSLWLLWPAASLAMATVSCLGSGAAIYRKRDGRLPMATWLVLAPLLVGQWLSWRHYAKQSRAYDAVDGSLLIGRRLTSREAQDAIENHNIVAVLDMTGEFSECPPFRALAYLNLQVADLTPPSMEQIREGLAFIRAHAPRGKVYLHCKAGYSRSAAIAGAALLEADPTLNVRAAVERLYATRPGIVVRPEIVAALERFVAARDGERVPACLSLGHDV